MRDSRRGSVHSSRRRTCLSGNREGSTIFANAKARDALNKVYRDRAKLLRELIGSDVFAAAGVDADAERQREYGNLSAAKIDLIQRINHDYTEISAQIRAEMQDLVLPEDRAKLELLERERRVDLAALLTPQKLADYDTRTSRTLGSMRAARTAMDATEEEFRAIFGIARLFEERLYPVGPDLNFPFSPERRAAMLEMAGQLESTRV